MHIVIKTMIMTVGLVTLNCLHGTETRPWYVQGLSLQRYQEWLAKSDVELSEEWNRLFNYSGFAHSGELGESAFKKNCWHNKLKRKIGDLYSKKEFRAAFLTKYWDDHFVKNRGVEETLKYFTDLHKAASKTSFNLPVPVYSNNSSLSIPTATRNKPSFHARHARRLPRNSRYILYVVGSAGVISGSYLLYRGWKNITQQKKEKERSTKPAMQCAVGLLCCAVGTGMVWYAYTH